MESAAPKTERFEMRAPTDLLRKVDDWRRQEPDLPSRSEAIRRLIEAGLSKTSTAPPPCGGEPGESDKPAGSVAPAPKKPVAPSRKAGPAALRSKLE